MRRIGLFLNFQNNELLNVCFCKLTADGNYCVTCGADKTIKLWNPHKVEDGGAGVLLKTYSGHGYEVIDAQCSCDSSQLCSCSLDKTVFLWDVATGKITSKYRGHAGITSAASPCACPRLSV